MSTRSDLRYRCRRHSRDRTTIDTLQTDLCATAPARLATRLAFFTGGFCMACCAPLFPFFKASVGADEAAFGVILLCLGLGSVIAMPATGVIAAKHGARPMVLLGGFGLVAILPLLALAQTPVALGAGLFVFGASLGTIDVAMNLHGAEVEGIEKRPLMSNFHAMFSIGGLLGAALMTGLLSLSVPVLSSAVIGAAVAFIAMLGVRKGLLSSSGEKGTPFSPPRGIVILLAIIAAIAFLVEGAILDWGALLIIDLRLAAAEAAGIGYILFSIAMVAARLTGDRIVARVGEFSVLVAGGMAAIAGLAIVLVSPLGTVALSGFFLIGLGAANIVPIVFSAAGRQTIMPAGVAIASVTTTGYAGILLGPALIGFVADTTSLSVAFWLLASLFTVIPMTARLVVRA